MRTSAGFRFSRVIFILSAAALLAAVIAPPLPAARFIRGDADENGDLEITDAVRILSHLFLGDPVLLGCLDAGDADDNGTLEITDPVTILGFLFLGEQPLAPPYPSCGLDPTPDRLDCGAHQGCAGAPCGGIRGIPCDEGFICDPISGACGGADLPGECVPRPGDCPELFDPVCGCDGFTYVNDCERLRAGVQKNHDGPCEQSRVCGGILGLPCDKGQFCDLPPGSCEGADFQGICVEQSDACPENFDPVCGCDGKTYSNDCERIRAGVSKRHDGACNQVQVCGGIAGLPCEDKTHFCEFPPGTCGSADLQGICRPRPEACPAIFDPVCGCDGLTYSNDCERAAAGVSLLHEGPCDARP